jgi:DNA-binding PadR family transcriptional regulator
VVEGTVYTILVRLEKNKLVSIEKKPSDMGPPRKFYKLTKEGREELKRFWTKWDFVSSKINELKEK